MSHPKVVCAAVRIEAEPNRVFTLLGARHWDKVMNEHFKLIGDAIIKEEIQGFVDSRGGFLTRVEAMELVKKNGQSFDFSRNGDQDLELYSEGIY